MKGKYNKFSTLEELETTLAHGDAYSFLCGNEYKEANAETHAFKQNYDHGLAMYSNSNFLICVNYESHLKFVLTEDIKGDNLKLKRSIKEMCNRMQR